MSGFEGLRITPTNNDKGYFATEAALNTAYATGSNGWFATVGATDTIWVWDSDLGAWYDSGNTGYIKNVSEDTSPDLGGNLGVGAFTVGSATAADLTKLNAVTSSAAELNVLDGIPGTLTFTELGYCDGVTSGIQGQLNTKLENIVEDTTPELAANLDAKEFDIDNLGNLIHNEAAVTDFTIQNIDLDKDILFSVNDGGTQATIMTLDASERNVEITSAGAAGSETVLILNNPADVSYSASILDFKSRSVLRGQIICQQLINNNDGYFIFKTWNGTDLVDSLRLSTTEVAFNEGSRDIDFRVESNGNENIIFADGSTNKVGIGTGTPAEVLDVVGSIQLTKSIYQDIEIDNGNSGAAKTIDWTAGNLQKVTMTDNCTFTFTAPAGACHVQLRSIQDAGGTNTYTWTGGGLSITWVDATEPTWTTTGDAINIHNFYYDGSAWWGAGGKWAA